MLETTCGFKSHLPQFSCIRNPDFIRVPIFIPHICSVTLGYTFLPQCRLKCLCPFFHRFCCKFIVSLGCRKILMPCKLPDFLIVNCLEAIILEIQVFLNTCYAPGSYCSTSLLPSTDTVSCCPLGSLDKAKCCTPACVFCPLHPHSTL